MAHLIWTLLNHHLYSDAIRLAEMYHAEVKTEDSLYLVALSYFRARKINSAYQVIMKSSERTSNCNQAKCRLLLAQCCYELEKFQQAEQTLLGDDFTSDSTISLKDQLLKEYGESSAAIAAQYAGLVY